MRRFWPVAYAAMIARRSMMTIAGPCLWHITKPVWQWSAGIPPLIWWNNLERIFMAVDDLGCRELLD